MEVKDTTSCTHISSFVTAQELVKTLLTHLKPTPKREVEREKEPLNAVALVVKEVMIAEETAAGVDVEVVVVEQVVTMPTRRLLWPTLPLMLTHQQTS